MSARLGGVTKMIEANMRDRGGTARGFVSSQQEVLGEFASELTGLKPVQAAVTLLVGSAANLGALIKENAEITRRWLKGLTR